MKLPLLALLAVPCVLLPATQLAGCSAYAWNSIQGSGVEKSEAREVPAFTRVHVSGSADTRIRVGPAQSLTVRCDDNLLQYVRTEVDGDALEIDMEPGSYSFEAGLTIEITVPALEAVSISGSGDASVEGLAGERFQAAISGSGGVHATGTTGALEASVSGSGDMDFTGLRAKTGRVSIAGSGGVDLDVGDALDVKISGSGDVKYSGNPQVHSSISGSGTVGPR